MARLSALLLGAAIGAAAHPSHHGHLHNKARQVEERADGDWIVATIGGEVVSWIQSGDYYGGASTAAPSSTVSVLSTATTLATVVTTGTTSATATAATATSTATAGGSATGTTVDTYTPFSSLCGTTSSKRATKEQIAAVGNTGADGDFGCNYALTSSSTVADAYDNYVKFYGATEDMTCYYWNKISKTGLINGWMTNQDSYWSFDLPAGATEYLVVDNGTYGGATCQPASLAPVTNSDTGLLYTWIEWTFVDSTTGWSDVDASSIQAQLAGGVVNGLEITADAIEGVVSSIAADAAAIVNAFDSGLIDTDGLGVQCAGALKVNANFGFSG